MNFSFPVWLLVLAVGAAGGLPSARAQTADTDITARPWTETRSAHFSVESCGSARDVNRLIGRLEQFCQAYAELAGAEAVDSPPIVVLAFPDHAALEPFLPLYDGRPANMAAFFHHGLDENLIVLSLPEPGQPDADLRVIFHEYSHLLFRRNDQIWPLWMKEGMAENYSTFQATGRVIRLAAPILWHLELLHQHPLMPLADLFAVREQSAEYNERSRQGRFYAESWLLTQYLMAGDDPHLRARFGQFTTRLRAGEEPVSAFTNALQTTLPALQNRLYHYLARNTFTPLYLTLPTNLASTVRITVRPLPPAEVCFRLGDELMRINRASAARTYFNQGHDFDPRNPLPEAGLGLLAGQANEHHAALRHLEAAVQLGADSYLVLYACALEELRATAPDGEHFQPIAPKRAEIIRAHLARVLALMPQFAPGQELCGFFELVQGEHLDEAGSFLQHALTLEPQNPQYQFCYAQYQFRTHDFAGARATMAPLLRPNADPAVRAEANELLQQMAAAPSLVP